MLLIKRGEYGAACFTRDSFFATPAYPLEGVFDPTGAGDSFAGGFMGYLAQSGNLDDMMTVRRGIVYGSIMASFIVEEFSCDRLRRVTEADISNRLGEFKDFTHFDLDENVSILRGAVELSTASKS
jgi:sugar/nucleoside kinase (ribokinase family)